MGLETGIVSNQHMQVCQSQLLNEFDFNNIEIKPLFSIKS